MSEKVDEDESSKTASTEDDEIASTSKIKINIGATNISENKDEKETLKLNKMQNNFNFESSTDVAKSSEIVEADSSKSISTKEVDIKNTDISLEKVVDEKEPSKIVSSEEDEITSLKIETGIALAKLSDKESSKIVQTKENEIENTSNTVERKSVSEEEDEIKSTSASKIKTDIAVANAVDEKKSSNIITSKDEKVENNLEIETDSAVVNVSAEYSSKHMFTKEVEIKNTSDSEKNTSAIQKASSALPTKDAIEATTFVQTNDGGHTKTKDQAKEDSSAIKRTEATEDTLERKGSSLDDENTAARKDINEKENPTKKSNIADDDQHAEHVSYSEDGSAIYTDPKTNYKYKWSTEQNNWVPCDSNNSSDSSSTSAADNPYENEHYKWCSETQQWLPKAQDADAAAQTATETEHYKWDAERSEWVPKVQQPTTTTIKPDDITYDIDEDGQRIYTDKDGTVFFWDTQKNAWFPKIDDDFMARYQMNYGFIDNTSAGEQEKLLKQEQEVKRKEEELQRMAAEALASEAALDATATGGAVKRKAPQEPPKWFDLDPEQNTKVYVSNLPLDITLDEFAEIMGKCGMIMRDPQTQKYKLKLYTEADGQIKGDGLCDYIKVESVHLALNILDDSELRGNKIHVQRAKFQMRGEYNPALKPKRKKKDKEKLLKMKEKLFDWRPEKMRGERSKNEKVVILKNLFHPDIFEKEVQLILDYQNDLREECSKCGTVRKIVIYDRHVEGVAQVNMASPEEADVVIQMMQGRFFGKRQLSAEHWDGKTKYKIVESETEVKQRLSKWDQFLETEEVKNQSKIPKSQPHVDEVVAEKVVEETNEQCTTDTVASSVDKEDATTEITEDQN